MSEIAVRDNNVPDSQRINGGFSNGKVVKAQVEGVSENSEEMQRKGMAAVVGTSAKIDETENSEAVVTSIEVEYIESEDLKDVEDVDDCLKVMAFSTTLYGQCQYCVSVEVKYRDALLSGLGSKDWVTVCDALNNVRRLSIFHKEAIVSMLEEVISLVVKSLKNPRSAVCKTAIMTASDLFKAYNDSIIDSLDPLLVQLLLKSSQDKKFVCEAAESALVALTSWVSPVLLLPKLQPYVTNRNPRIRAKASICISRSVPRLGMDGIQEFGIDKLIVIGASQLSDRLPESRDAARALLLELQSAYEKSQAPEPTAVPEQPQVPKPTAAPEQPAIVSWEDFCQSKLSTLSAQAVLRVTNSARELDRIRVLHLHFTPLSPPHGVAIARTTPQSNRKLDVSPDESEESAFFRRRCCWPWKFRRSSAPKPKDWERISTSDQSDRRWWSGGVEAFMKVREWSELVAGLKWKTFIRRFNRAPARAKFNYDPCSYAQNFDHGEGQNGQFDDGGAFLDFPSRYAAVPAQSSMLKDGH
ncbi:hypothetical protein SASPL_149577 [Salvia splendens]|uniref:TOG domain-containing protein n=1 Tax=Salvia splendens TaxID=180675 RepID=A0A8X8Z5C8_SALSN|nr:hypothetical protein SASPL_149577 [Salvia splendens]